MSMRDAPAWQLYTKYSTEYWVKQDVEVKTSYDTDLHHILLAYYEYYSSGVVLFCESTLEVFGDERDKESFKQHYHAGTLKHWRCV